MNIKKQNKAAMSYRTRFDMSMSRLRGVHFAKIGVSLAGLVIVSLLGINIMANNSASATGVTSNNPNTVSTNIHVPDAIESGGYFIVLEHTASEVDINLDSPSGTGYYGKNKDTLTVYTNSPSGYQLYLSSDQSTNFNKSDGSATSSPASDTVAPGNALFRDGGLGNQYYFAPTSSALVSPSTTIPAGQTAIGTTSESLDANSWGFNLSDNDKYASVPLKNQEVLIKKTNLNNTALALDDVSVKQDINIGVSASLSQPGGTYSGSILYTALADADSTLDGLATISPTSTENLDGGTEVTVRTSLFTNMEDLGNVAVYIGNYNSTSDTPQSGDACTVTSVYIDTSANNNLTIKCNTPAKAKGTYDVLVLVEKFGKKYLISDGFEYVQNLPEFFTITQMQQMTPAVCNSVVTPLASAGTTEATIDTTGEHSDDNTYVAQSTLYDYRGIDGTGTASNPVSDKNSSNYVEYTVRKLADGNCWMSENLKLTLTNNQPVLVGTFSGEETSWTPTGDGAGDDYNEAINANTKADVNGGNWYYPWYAATAGQGTNTASPTISQSICPKGWKLPNGGANAAPSFASLITTTYGIASSSAGSTTLQSAPLSFYYAGVYYFGSLNDTSYGYYWSASPYTRYNHLAYNLTFSSSYVYLQDNYNKSYGFSVRCVAIP